MAIYIATPGATIPDPGSNIVLRGGINVGNTFQRTDDTQQAVWMELASGVKSETATSITFAVRGGFAYRGYDNFVPHINGYLALKEDDTVYTSDATIDFHTQTKAEWRGLTYYTYTQYTMTKPSYPVWIVPYTQIGCINYWSTDGQYGKDWEYFNTYYGLMCMYSDSSGTASTYTKNNAFVSYNGNSRTLKCFSLFGNNSANVASHSYGYKVSGTMPVSVYDSSGKPHKAKGIWVYDSSGKPRKAKAITVYDSSGKPHTTSF